MKKVVKYLDYCMGICSCVIGFARREQILIDEFCDVQQRTTETSRRGFTETRPLPDDSASTWRRLLGGRSGSRVSIRLPRKPHTAPEQLAGQIRDWWHRQVLPEILRGQGEYSFSHVTQPRSSCICINQINIK